MGSLHLVDPEISSVLTLFSSMSLTLENLPMARNQFRFQTEAQLKDDGLQVDVDQWHLPGPHGAPQVRVLGYRPTAATGPLPAILQLHGGGYCLGSAEMMAAHNRLLAFDLHCAVFAVDYRLAPDTPHPGPLEDCYAALKWLYGNSSKLGLDPEHIGVKGESAGGGLAAALALVVRDRGEVPLAFQHLIYPMIDDRTCARPDPHAFTGEFIFTTEQNALNWRWYLNAEPGLPDISQYAAAARATNLANLPSCFIAVGSLDLFLEENMEYARRLTRAGVPTELHVYPGGVHGFNFASAARISIAMERDSRTALRRALHG